MSSSVAATKYLLEKIDLNTVSMHIFSYIFFHLFFWLLLANFIVKQQYTINLHEFFCGKSDFGKKLFIWPLPYQLKTSFVFPLFEEKKGRTDLLKFDLDQMSLFQLSLW